MMQNKTDGIAASEIFKNLTIKQMIYRWDISETV